MARFAAYDASGAPLAGLTPTWSAYFNAQTGAVVTGPVFGEVGGGLYEVDVPANECGMADVGASSSNRYIFFGSTSVPTFPAFALADGSPLAGLGLSSSSWSTVRDASGSVISPAPGIDELGGGIYRSASLPVGASGIVNLGATANPQYVAVDNAVAADTTAPAVSNLQPADGADLDPDEAVSFNVQDVGSGLRVVLVTARFPGTLLDELVYAGAGDATGFGQLYSTGSTVKAITSGFSFSLARQGGWPGQLKLGVYAVDQVGNEN